MRARPVRVVSSAAEHPYSRLLYADCPAVEVLPLDALGQEVPFDVFHLHWPEFLGCDSLEDHSRVLRQVGDRTVVLTAHNLQPHDPRDAVSASAYAIWAGRADVVLHHSELGARRWCRRYAARPGARHVLLPHLPWPHAVPERAEAERALGLAACGLRLGLLGAPRVGHDHAWLLRGLRGSARPDVQLCAWSLPPEFAAAPPNDPRAVVWQRHEFTGEAVYAQRLAACDALVLPVGADTSLLTSGVVADALCAGTPVLTAGWGYPREVLGEGAIDCPTAPELSRALDALAGPVLRHHGEVVRRRAAALDRAEVQASLLDALTR